MSQTETKNIRIHTHSTPFLSFLISTTFPEICISENRWVFRANVQHFTTRSPQTQRQTPTSKSTLSLFLNKIFWSKLNFFFRIRRKSLPDKNQKPPVFSQFTDFFTHFSTEYRGPLCYCIAYWKWGRGSENYLVCLLLEYWKVWEPIFTATPPSLRTYGNFYFLPLQTDQYRVHAEM